MADSKSPKVTVFKNFNQPIGDYPIVDILLRFKSDKAKKEIEPIRELYRAGKLKEYTTAKQQLHAITPAGTFKNGVKIENFVEYSHLVILDIDHKSEDEVIILKQKIIAIPYTYACFISPSGAGLKVLVKVDNDWQQHEKAFCEVKNFYEEVLCVSIDRTGRNLNRLCFTSYDAEVYINRDKD